MATENETPPHVSGRTIGDPGPALTFIFTMLTMCFWGIYAGIYDGPPLLAVGLVQLACFVPYLIGAIVYYLRGDTMSGTVFLAFAALFGGIGGILNVAVGLKGIFGFEMCTQLAAIPFIWGSLVLLPLIASSWKTGSAAGTLCFISIVIFLTLMALVDLGVLPASTNVVIKWLCFFTAVDGYYTGLNSLLAVGGLKKLPEGKPIGLWFAK